MTEPRIRRTGRRRVVTDPVPGTDPTPQAVDPVRATEDTDAPWGGAAPAAGSGSANDERLRQDVPPHWHSSV